MVITVVIMGLSPPDFSRGDMVSGTAVIIDGDTVVIDGRRIEFFGIDAPEIDQTCRVFDLVWPCGERARILLVGLIGKTEVRCLPRKTAAVTPRSQDVKAMCFNDRTINLNAAMVGKGMAVANLDDGDWFAVATSSARINRLGLWAGEFITPIDWRRGRRLRPSGSGPRKKLKP